ncbi:Uncharacterized conserved protein YecE, DUF72 family [Rhizobium sp. NFR07]|uniref:DUF72 domain-containing protein n=1 Tax=Rhizobium sp. NFR07 TaxID=1566262 RepID=UPI0008E2202D|nr:DUF72 domain-containing protein [Rhizobium sp. NFR07]SFB50784.1 Uncharacterized conserved protein YecE, DUF72 family [Rhizobium sp. NFR07]
MQIVATAAWSIPKTVANRFATEGSSLTRYASVFGRVEVNSTFYRRHRTSTFARWAESVPDSFRFSLKFPKEITHTRLMKDIAQPLETFLSDISALGNKRGPLVCQLPPSLVFDLKVFDTAFHVIRSMDDGPIAIEPRHKSWRCNEALDLMESYSIDRAYADPVLVWQPEDFADAPRYMRLHGKPRIYYSSYTERDIKSFLSLLAPGGWCVFDNTASGAATENALTMLGPHRKP